ncbi:MAG: DUF2079 domain-containing protein [Chloroflexi bacterium]|nr:DUF2079 domain-containing protein [Chloroflexota bacterium]
MTNMNQSLPISQKTKDLLPTVIVLGLIIFVFAEMSSLSIAKFQGFNSKYFDLGAMSQAIWSAGKGFPLIFTGQGIAISRLSRNVELFYFALAPIYALFPSPQTLLLIQAALYALGGWPLFKLANRRLQHRWMAVAITAVYLFYPVAQTAVLAEFHSDPLAASFLMFAIEAADRRAWKTYAGWLLLALSCKFYVAAPVAALGAVLWLQGERRAGIATTLTATMWGLIAFFAIRAHFAPPAAAVAQAVNVQSSTLGYFFNRFQIAYIGETAVIRLIHAVIVLMPALLLLAWRAPFWLLPAAVTIIPALLSNGFGPSFSYRTHHYALAVPFLITAVLFGAAKQIPIVPDSTSKSKRPAWQGRILLTLFMVIIFNLAFIDTPISPQFFLDKPALEQGQSNTRFGLTDRDSFKANWLTANVPANTPIAADQLSAIRLTNRETLFLTNYVFGRPLEELLPDVSFVVSDALYDWALVDPINAERVLEGGAAYEHGVIQTLLTHSNFQLLQAQDGLLLFGRANEGLTQTVTRLPKPESASPIATFANDIGLSSYTIEELSSRRYQIQAEWQLLQETTSSPNRFAVTRLQGVSNMRIVHLPASIMAPAKSWAADELIQETFEIELPQTLAAGTYDLWLGWYNADHIFAAHTDERSRIGAEVHIGSITVP